MPRAQSADGVIHDFPEGTDPGVIDRVMRDYAQAQKPALTLGGEPAGAPSAQPPGFLAGLGHAVAERGMGLAQGMSHLMGPIPETALIPPEAIGMLPPSQIGEMAKREVTPQAVDKGVQKLEQDYAAKRKAGGSSASTWAGEAIGGVAADTALTAPLMAIGGGTGFVSGIVSGLGIGAGAGAITGAAEPVTGGDYGKEKTRQVGTSTAVGGAVGGVLGGLAGAIARNDPKQVESIIRSSYYKSVKPGTTMTAPQREVYDSNVREAVDAIIESRGGRPLPKTVDDFSKAIAEAKSSVYDRYSGMASAAEQKGAKVLITPAADRLKKLAIDPLQDPAARAEAERLLKAVPDVAASITPQRAESVMAFLNERATGFDTQGSKGAGSVFRQAARWLREELVASLERSGYPEYGKLRRAYGSLAEIEDDVGRAVGRELSRGGKTFGLTETAATGMIGAGEPTSAVAMESGKRFFLWLNSPNRAIAKLFEAAASLGREPSATERAGEVTRRLLPAASGTAGDAAARMSGSR